MAGGNPVADDEARRLGEKPDADLSSSGEPVPIGTAEKVLAAALPVASSTHWSQMADGRWVEHETGLVQDEPPFTP